MRGRFETANSFDAKVYKNAKLLRSTPTFAVAENVARTFAVAKNVARTFAAAKNVARTLALCRSKAR